MSYQRSQRVAEEIKREISDIIMNGIKDPRIGGLISITGVRVTDDLRHAKVFVSIFGEDDIDKNETYEALKNATGFIRREIGNRIRLRNTPDIAYVLDKSIEYSINISKLLKEVGADDNEG